MAKDEKAGRSDVIPAVMMGCLFVIIHGLALLVTRPFETAGIEPAFENPNDPINLAYFFLIIFIMTAVIIVIAKYWKKELIQLIILGAIGYTAFYAFFLPVFVIILPTIIPEIILVFAALAAVILVTILYKYPEWYVVDISGIVVGTSAIVIFGMSLGVLLVIILLIGLAIYDAISVYKTKHMIDLADTVMDLKLPVLLVIPKTRHYSLIKETKTLKESLEEGQERDAFFMGLGDVVMPGILVASVYHVENGFPIALSVIAGTLFGFAVLMIFVLKGKPQAGLPCLCGGAILGYVISSLILHGTLVGLTMPF